MNETSACCESDCHDDDEGRLVCDNCGDVCDALKPEPTREDRRRAYWEQRARDAGRD